jgi:hypothetical protein
MATNEANMKGLVNDVVSNETRKEIVDPNVRPTKNRLIDVNDEDSMNNSCSFMT